ncbi:uncharacterized protein LOC131010566 [Salvia miltiorrhiza]|uniref:uncharacterized protein LOC131010566 n=1 Tax=Salvia miltiorrhiza TaxID=226208 RepID=UPI0025AB844A|nr:uncharacterized protein LOC131010566 [Salvia miltiorrhiza]
MGCWDEGVWRWKLEWSREPRGRELDQIQSLISFIDSCVLRTDKRDGWRWKASSNGAFSVKSAYEAISREKRQPNEQRKEGELTQIWKTKAPAKAIITAWKVLKGRLPTLDNLIRRQVPIQPPIFCVFCKEKEESIDHLFFSCSKSEEVWKELIQWMGKQVVFHHKAKPHFNVFVNLGHKEDVMFLTAVWICVVWCVWKKRNECIFNQGSWIKERMVSEIKTRIWGWSLAFNLNLNTSDFCSWNATACLHG